MTCRLHKPQTFAAGVSRGGSRSSQEGHAVFFTVIIVYFWNISADARTDETHK